MFLIFYIFPLVDTVFTLVWNKSKNSVSLVAGFAMMMKMKSKFFFSQIRKLGQSTCLLRFSTLLSLSFFSNALAFFTIFIFVRLHFFMLFVYTRNLSKKFTKNCQIKTFLLSQYSSFFFLECLIFFWTLHKKYLK